jgi:hypothetical protein
MQVGNLSRFVRRVTKSDEVDDKLVELEARIEALETP